MSFFPPSRRDFLEALSGLLYCNPFLPERLEWERQLLGDDFQDAAFVWSKRQGWEDERPNVLRAREHVEALAAETRARLAGEPREGLAGATRSDPASRPTAAEWEAYENLVVYLLYYRYRERLEKQIEESREHAGKTRRLRWWPHFLDDFHHFLRFPDLGLASSYQPEHLLACYFQVRRAFDHIYHFIVGGSSPAARLRAAAWQSVFTHDMRRYRRTLFARMNDVTTLIVGPSGTGKELVARAVGLSRYIPFDAAAEQFREDFADSFHALNLSALSPTLIESELFGHCRGAFTGAVGERAGWLEVCSPCGTVFLDEIGELDAAIQIKLLRVLQDRVFQRLGESSARRFEGKIIAATNRDLADEMRAGRFRQDFYYRLCSDMIRTPSLAEQLQDSPDDLRELLLHIAERVAGAEAPALAEEVERFIRDHLPADHGWPGNIRELEQCVRNVMVRRAYHPPPRVGNGGGGGTRGNGEAAGGSAAGPAGELLAALEAGALSAEELLRFYCTLLYARLGNLEQTAQRLGLDRRTVKAKIDPRLLERFRSGP